MIESLLLRRQEARVVTKPCAFSLCGTAMCVNTEVPGCQGHVPCEVALPAARAGGHGQSLGPLSLPYIGMTEKNMETTILQSGLYTGVIGCIYICIYTYR